MMNVIDWTKNRSPLPTRKDEYYRPTNLDKVSDHLAQNVTASIELIKEWISEKKYVLTFNGPDFLNTAKDLKKLPPGVNFKQINGPSIEEKAGPSVLHRWQQTLTTHYLLEVVDGIELNDPIWILNLASRGLAGFCPLKIQVKIGAGANVTLARVLSNQLDGLQCFQALQMSIAPNAEVDVVSLYEVGPKSWGLDRTEVKIAEKAKFQHTTVALGGELFRQEIDVQLLAPSSSCQLDGQFITQDKEYSDHVTNIAHHAPDTTSRQLYKGMLDNSSRAVFKGNIYVHPQAQRVVSTQLNKNLLLTNSAEVMTRPQLEIYADDVKCSHGATVGQLSAEEIFYLQSRGISAANAQTLLAQGFASEILMGIKNEAIRKVVDQSVQRKLKALSSVQFKAQTKVEKL